MTMFGADVAALRRLAIALRHQQAEIDASRQRVSVIIETLSWAGPDHDEFADDWNRVHRRDLAAIAAELGGASDQVRDHARRQELASQRR